MKKLFTIFSIFFIFTAIAYGQFDREIDHKILGLGKIYTADISPDGTKLAAGGFSGIIHIWDLEFAEVIKTINTRNFMVYDLTWNPDGSTIACIYSNKDWTFNEYVDIWDVETGQKIKTLTDTAGYVDIIEWSPDGSKIAGAKSKKQENYNHVIIWDSKLGEVFDFYYMKNQYSHYPGQF